MQMTQRFILLLNQVVYFHPNNLNKTLKKKPEMAIQQICLSTQSTMGVILDCSLKFES